MKNLNEYLSLAYRMEISEDTSEGGFIVSFPELPGCISSGETIESAIKNIQNAKQEWLSAAIEEGLDIPMPNSSEDYSGQFKLRIPKTLHKKLAENSKKEGISMNQYCLFLLSRNDALRHPN
ncbi:MAG: toxin-antitoxin system HicB family antitoxin [Eubacteriales bacterium]|nr:toxin-antitoxin system HicB family antitoxin [Eubacteriales bacterium]